MSMNALKQKQVTNQTIRAKEIAAPTRSIDRTKDKTTITTLDVFQSNGVIHVVDTVLMPS